MLNTETVEQELNLLKERNKRVEAEKAWETSRTRIGVIAVITYCVAVVLMFSLGNSTPFLAALMPTAGFFLSTQSLPMVKRWWINKYQ
jgi:fatty acid desaturase